MENSIEAIIRVVLSLINIDGVVHEKENILKFELFQKFNNLADHQVTPEELALIEKKFNNDLEMAKKNNDLNKFFKDQLFNITDPFLSSTLLISLISLAKSDNEYHHLEKEYIELATKVWGNL
tara:strand:+ start:397 stop:765 length:369 start_codon:yes stop_codon:yes gene_type:complete